MHISDSVRATASEQLTVTDVMAALGMTQADAGIGLAMYLGKAGVSKQDRDASINWLAEYAKQSAPFAVRRLAGKKFPSACLSSLSSPITTMHRQPLIYPIAQNATVGLIEKVGTVTKSHYTMRIPQWAKDLDSRHLLSKRSGR
jgi:hypothetical protein